MDENCSRIIEILEICWNLRSQKSLQKKKSFMNVGYGISRKLLNFRFIFLFISFSQNYRKHICSIYRWYRCLIEARNFLEVFIVKKKFKVNTIFSEFLFNKLSKIKLKCLYMQNLREWIFYTKCSSHIAHAGRNKVKTVRIQKVNQRSFQVVDIKSAVWIQFVFMYTHKI